MKRILVTLFIGLYALSCYSQINIRKETVYYQKPSAYDSLQDLQSFDKKEVHNYLKYIGQKLYFKPLKEKDRKEFCFNEFIVDGNIAVQGSLGTKSNTYKPVTIKHAAYQEIGSDIDLLENKTFIILNAFAGHNIKAKKKLIPENMVGEGFLFVLLDENNDTLYWKTYLRQTGGHNNLIIQGFYDKQISLYKDQTFVYREGIPYAYVAYGDEKTKNDYEKIITSNISFRPNEGFTDLNSHQQIKPADSSFWKCTDVSLIEEPHSYELFYILKNETGNEIKIPLKKLPANGFVFKESHDTETRLRMLKIDERKALHQRDSLQREEYMANRKKHMISKYGQKYGILIAEGKVALGMTKAMCSDAWGETDRTIQNNTLDVWVYSYRSSLYFRGDELVQIVNL